MKTACSLLHPYALTVRHGLPFAAQWCGLCHHLVFPVPSEAPAPEAPRLRTPGLRWRPVVALSGKAG